MSSIHSLFEAISTSSSEQELRFRFMDGVTKHFEVQRWGVYLLDEDCKNLASVDVVGVSDTFVEQYEKIGRSVDLVLEYVLENHAPAHEELILPQGGWKQSELYQRCCSRYDHEHIMTGPIVGRGQLIGTIHFARIGKTPAFNYYDLAKLGAVCTHFSACLAELRQQSSVNFNPLVKRLTPRELQIADLVASGLTNAAIGSELWITQNSVKQALKRMFRKLEVSSRTEMVAKLRAPL
ncbi:MAG: LuxR C-terminal-related transcriptional regulator [Xenococcus sp. (in: cyanobacteria)]